MNNVNTDYATFSVIDYTGSATTLSSYNLSITPFTLIPEIPSNLGQNNKVVWDFGNGDKSTVYSPTYHYTTPGVYTIKLYVYDCYNKAVLATNTVDVAILNYIEDTFTVTTFNNTSLSGNNGILLPIRFNQTLPYNYKSSTISYKVSGANTTNYFLLSAGKYNHLQPYHSVLKAEYIPSLSQYELVEVETISLTLSAIYATLEGTTITTALTSSDTSIIAGYSATDISSYYYRDDLPTDYYTITFYKTPFDYTNTLSVTLKGTIFNNFNSTPAQNLSITSNGIDGDYFPLSTFNISENKFNDTKIHFVVKIKDSLNNTLKNFDKLTLISDPSELSYSNPNAIYITMPGYSDYTITSLHNTLTSFDYGGCFRGYLTYTGTLTAPLTDVYLNASIMTLTDTEGNDQSYDIAGTSNTFNIYPKNYYTLYKKGEDFDGEQTFKDLRFQETILDKNRFFENFLGTIFGNREADTEALGKKVYERIRNFNDNIVNIDRAEIPRLISLGNMVDYKTTIFDKNLISFPNKIQRITSLLSISKNNLFGIKNKFVENFNDYGITTKELYGINLGDKINTDTYMISPDRNIVAYEKFSKTYKLLNTMQLLSASCGDIFLTDEELNTLLDESGNPLTIDYNSCFAITLSSGLIAFITTQQGDTILTSGSASLLATLSGQLITDYTINWGWPLVLPENFTAQDITTFYDFYEFNDVYLGDIVGGTLDFNLTTVDFDTSYSDLQRDGGIYDNIILDTLYQSLSL